MVGRLSAVEGRWREAGPVSVQMVVQDKVLLESLPLYV